MRFQSGAKPETEGKFTPKASGLEPQIEHEMPAQEHPVSVQSVEPEEPQQAGSSKPEQREALERNVSQGQAKPHPETVAAQHATGSFTDKKQAS